MCIFTALRGCLKASIIMRGVAVAASHAGVANVKAWCEERSHATAPGTCQAAPSAPPLAACVRASAARQNSSKASLPNSTKCTSRRLPAASAHVCRATCAAHDTYLEALC